MTAADPPERLRWTPELVARFWDFESTRPQHYFTNQYGQAVVAELRPLLTPTSRVLDYGCGAGFLIGHLLGLGCSVTGADFSPSTVRQVDLRFHNRPDFAGAYHVDELRPDQRFDVILCCEVVEHLEDDELTATLQRLRQLLSPGGVVALTTPNDEDLAASEVYCPVSNVVFHRWQHVRSWNVSTLSSTLKAHGFELTEVRTLHFGRTLRSGRGAWTVDRVRSALHRLGPDPHLLAVARSTR